MSYLTRLSSCMLLVSASLLSTVSAADETFNDAALGIYQDPGYALNHDYSTSGANDSVDPFSGALKIVNTDLSIPGNGGLDINVVRNYQSVTNNVNGPYSNGRASRTVFGTGWDINFGRILASRTYGHLAQGSNNKVCQIPYFPTSLNPILELPDGTRETLVNSDGVENAFITKGKWAARCLPSALNVNNDGGLIVFSPKGLKYTFNLIGTTSPDLQLRSYFVTRIEDISGNYLDFTYSKTAANTFGPHHVLQKITASDGRVVTFNYSDISGPQALLTSITGAGKTVQYSYVNALSNIGPKAQYLTKVTYPDATTWAYTYNDQVSAVGDLPGRYSIASMKSPQGLSTTYQYAYQQMGLDPKNAEKLNIITKKTLAAVRGSTIADQVWTYQYTQGGFHVYDQTLETGPTSCIQYAHIGEGTIGSGEVSNVDQKVWEIGLLAQKQTMEKSGSACGAVIKTEDYSWQSMAISSQKEMRRYNLLVDSQTYRPFLGLKTVTQDGKTYTTANLAIDSNTNVTQSTETGSKTRTTTSGWYAGSNWPTWWFPEVLGVRSISDIPGEVDYSYNNKAQLLGINKYGVRSTYSYDAQGNIFQYMDPNGFYTYYTNYYRGIPRQENYPDNGVLTRTVNDNGTVASVTDPLKRTTTFTYDSMDRLATVLPPKGAASQVTMAYSFTAANVLETLKRGAYSRVREYNQLGQLVKQTESGTGVTPIVATATYTPNGQRAFVSNPSYTTASTLGESFTYDALDRSLTNVHADGSKATYAYGADSVSTTDERGNVTTNTYASFGEPNNEQLVSITQPGGGVETTTTDNLDRVTSVSLGGLTRSYAYDSRGYLISETHPETGVTTYTRDSMGNVRTKQIGSAPADTYYYDSRGRLTNIDYGTQELDNSYDLGGRLLTQKFDGTTRTYAYDVHDKLISEQLQLSNPVRSYTVSYSYNAQDALASMTYPSGKVIDYAPDAMGRATKAGAYASAASYYPAGALNTLNFGSGAALTVSQDNRLRTSQRLVKGATGSTLMQQQYGYDVASNLTSINDSVTANNNQTMTYDGLNRLVSQSVKSYYGSPNVYGYNVRGDLVTNWRFGQYYNQAYDAQGRLSKINWYAPQVVYDAKGNITRAHHDYSYDAAGNMQSLCYSTGRADCATHPDLTFAYDGSGHRVSKNPQTPNVGYPQVLSFYSKGGKLLQEESPSSNLINEYIYLGGERVAVANATDTRYFHNDNLGSPSVFSGAGSGASTHFRPFGEREEYGAYYDVNGDTWSNNEMGYGWCWYLPDGSCTSDVEKVFGRVGFTGHVQDTDIGLIYAGARYLDPIIGRFLSIDPDPVEAGKPQTFNRYAYAGNNPYKFVDPDGRNPVLIAGAVVVLAIVVAEMLPSADSRTHNRESSFGDDSGFHSSKNAVMPISASSAEGGANASDPLDVTKRPSGFRKKTVQDAWDNAQDGSIPDTKACVTCGRNVNIAPGQGPRDWDVDHQPPWSLRDLSGKSRPEVLNEYNQGTRLECPGCNRSRGAEPAIK